MVRRAWAFFTRPNVLVVLAVAGWIYEQTLGSAVNLWREQWLIEHGAAQGPPPGMLEWFQGFIAHYLVPAVTFATGPFGAGLLVGGAVFAIPDAVGSIRRWLKNMSAKQQSAIGSAEAAALRELHVIKAVRLKTAFDAIMGMMGGFVNVAMAGRNDADRQMLMLAIDYQGCKYHEAMRSLVGPLQEKASLIDNKEELRHLIKIYKEFYHDAERFHNTAYYKISDAGGIDSWKLAHREFVSRFGEAARVPMLDDLRQLADEMPLYESSFPQPSAAR